jgi:hypothetical protein
MLRQGKVSSASLPLEGASPLPPGYVAFCVETDDGGTSLCVATPDFDVVSAGPLGQFWTPEWTMATWLRCAAKAWQHFRSSTQPQPEDTP